MDLTSYVESLRHGLAVAAEAGGEEARLLAERLVAPLESAVRLALLDALSAAAEEITRELAPGSVDLRLRGREPTFVVTPPPTEFDVPAAPRAVPDSDDSATARINFRLPENLKSRVEEAAGRAGLSVNAWLVRAVANSLDSDRHGIPGPQPAPRIGQRFTGWVR
jgi:hypothetical protein